MEHFTFFWDESEVINKVLLGIKAIMPAQQGVWFYYS